MKKKKQIVEYSCVIGSSITPKDINKNIIIRNPFGTDEIELAFENIRLALLACFILKASIVFVLLEIRFKTEENEDVFVYVHLDMHQLLSMDKDEIIKYLSEQSLKEFKKQIRRRKRWMANCFL